MAHTIACYPVVQVELSEDAKDQMRKMLKQKETNYLRLKRAKMNRSMFDVIKKLGIGAFGEVSLVRKKVVEKGEPQGEQLYAMKTLRKVCCVVGCFLLHRFSLPS